VVTITLLETFSPHIYTPQLFAAHANALREYLYDWRDHRQEEGKERDEDDSLSCSVLDNIEEFVRFTMVIRFNSVELQPPEKDGSGPGTNYGHGLFERACTMNHSCRPNCVWFTTQDGTSKEVRAITTIEIGEELTVDYVGNALDPTAQRRDDLLKSKGFICQCERCSAEHDDTRRFKCITSAETACTGAHFLHQPTYSSVPLLLNCGCCGAKATGEFVESVMKDEIALVQEINALDEAAEEACIVDVQERIERLEPPHKHHSLADKCYRLQGELYSILGDYRNAAEAYAKSIDCRIAILGAGYYNQATAFACEKLGDALKHVDVYEAEEAYKRSVRALEMMRGSAHSDPYAKCAMGKLLHVQNRRIHGLIENLPTEDCLKGIAAPPAGPPVTDFPCQLCGNPAMIPASSREDLSYCCEFHKKMHLAVVKEGCFCIEEEKTWD
jgi:SET domain